MTDRGRLNSIFSGETDISRRRFVRAAGAAGVAGLAGCVSSGGESGDDQTGDDNSGNGGTNTQDTGSNTDGDRDGESSSGNNTGPQIDYNNWVADKENSGFRFYDVEELPPEFREYHLADKGPGISLEEMSQVLDAVSYHVFTGFDSQDLLEELGDDPTTFRGYEIVGNSPVFATNGEFGIVNSHHSESPLEDVKKAIKANKDEIDTIFENPKYSDGYESIQGVQKVEDPDYVRELGFANPKDKSVLTRQLIDFKGNSYDIEIIYHMEDTGRPLFEGPVEWGKTGIPEGEYEIEENLYNDGGIQHFIAEDIPVDETRPSQSF